MATELRDTSPALAPPPATGARRRRWRHLLGILGPGLVTGAAIPLIWFIDRIAADRGTMGKARSGWLSRSTLMLTFIGMAGSVVAMAMAISYIRG
jgi:hypothetical protein